MKFNAIARLRRPFAWLTCCLAFSALTMSAHAETGDAVYKWVDQNGVVNYGSAPPKGVAGSKQVQQIDTTQPVVDHASAEEKRAREKQRTQELEAMQDDRLKRQLVQEQIETEQAKRRALQSQTAKAEADQRLAQARADCLASGRPDCSSDGTESTTVYYPVRPIVRPRPWIPPPEPPKPPVTKPTPSAGVMVKQPVKVPPPLPASSGG